MPKLKPFDKSEEKKQKNKKIMIAIPSILVIVAVVIVASSYAIFQKQEEGMLIKGTIGDFDKGDIKLAITVDGKETTTVPSKAAYNVTVSCDKATGEWDYVRWGAVVTNIKGTKTTCNLDFKSYSTPFSTYLINLSNTDASLVKETHDTTDQTGSNAVTDYRYIGADPNNYVCLGARSCSAANSALFRIIGVIPTQTTVGGAYENRVKLIRINTYTSSYMWSGNSKVTSTDWTKSDLNNATLNTDYWSYVPSHQPYIGSAVWYLGSSSASVKPSTVYVNERKGSSSTSANIGLMYASDFGYATSGGSTKDRAACLATNMSTSKGSNYADCWENNWLMNAEDYSEWTITASTSTSSIYTYGRSASSTYIGGVSTTSVTTGYAVRPVVYLKATVNYDGGDGSINNPYLLKLN